MAGGKHRSPSQQSETRESKRQDSRSTGSHKTASTPSRSGSAKEPKSARAYAKMKKIGQKAGILPKDDRVPSEESSPVRDDSGTEDPLPDADSERSAPTLSTQAPDHRTDVQHVQRKPLHAAADHIPTTLPSRPSSREQVLAGDNQPQTWELRHHSHSHGDTGTPAVLQAAKSSQPLDVEPYKLSSLQILQQALQDAKSGKEEVEGEVEALKRQIGQLREDLNMEKGKSASFASRADKLQTEVQGHDEAYRELAKHLHAAEQNVGALSRQNEELAKNAQISSEHVKTQEETLRRLRAKVSQQAAHNTAPPDQWPLRQPESKIIEAFRALSYDIQNDIVLNYRTEFWVRRGPSSWVESQQARLQNVAGPYLPEFAGALSKRHSEKIDRVLLWLIEAAIWSVLMDKVFVSPSPEMDGVVSWVRGDRSNLARRVTRLTSDLHCATIMPAIEGAGARGASHPKGTQKTISSNSPPIINPATIPNLYMLHQWKVLTASLVSQLSPNVSGLDEKILETVEDLEDLLGDFMRSMPQVQFRQSLAAIARKAIFLDRLFCGQPQATRYRLQWPRQGRHGFPYAPREAHEPGRQDTASNGGGSSSAGGGGRVSQSQWGGMRLAEENTSGAIAGTSFGDLGRYLGRSERIVKFVVRPALYRLGLVAGNAAKGSYGPGGLVGGRGNISTGGETHDEELCLEGPVVYV